MPLQTETVQFCITISGNVEPTGACSTVVFNLEGFDAHTNYATVCQILRGVADAMESGGDALLPPPLAN
jgi:hypothetical protein